MYQATNQIKRLFETSGLYNTFMYRMIYYRETLIIQQNQI